MRTVKSEDSTSQYPVSVHRLGLLENRDGYRLAAGANFGEKLAGLMQHSSAWPLRISRRGSTRQTGWWALWGPWAFAC